MPPLTDADCDKLVDLLLANFPDLRSDDCEDVAHRLSLEPCVIAADSLALAKSIRDGGR
jgi:hypothetical protein